VIIQTPKIIQKIRKNMREIYIDYEKLVRDLDSGLSVARRNLLAIGFSSL